jgi:transcriptional regulator with XRE-family HTH domain
MAFRRHELAQRRKAVGFTQESLAEHLGVERSTVIRWEAGDSEPLPSIRPSLARALQVSIDQLADLISRPEDAGAARGASADPEETAPVLQSPEVAPEGHEPELAIHPQVAETVETLRRALRSAGISAEDLAAMLLVDGSSTAPPGALGPAIPEPAHTDSPMLPAPNAGPPDVVAGEVQQRRSGSQAGKRFAVTGLFVLALPAALLSPPLEFSPGGANIQAGTLEPADPVFASSELNPALGAAGSARPADITTAPVIAPAEGVVPAPVPAAVPAPNTTGATGHSKTARRSTRSAAKTPSPSPRNWLKPATVAGDHWDNFSQVERFDHLW